MLQKGSPGEARHICQSLASPHTGASPRATLWAVVSATSLTTGCTGNLFCKAPGSIETQKQESRLPMRKCSLLLLRGCCFQRDPGLAVMGSSGVQQEVGARAPCKRPGSSSSGRSCLLPAWLYSTTIHVPEEGHGVPDGTRLAGCTAALMCDEPHQKGARCSAAGDS